MASAWTNYKGKYDHFCKTAGSEEGQDLWSQHNALDEEQTEALGYALGAIHRLGRSAPDEEGHRDASDDDYTNEEKCYGDEYCVCGCNNKDDASCPSEEEEVAEPKGAT